MPAPSTQIRSVDTLRGPAGRLEALLNTGSGDAPYAALVCHPHPAGGGTMHNKVVYRAMKVFAGFGLPALRFNFRGTGLSQGAHDDGRGEQEDVRAAIEWLDREFDRPIVCAGFSFGAYVALRACCGDARVRGLVALGLPVAAEGRRYDYGFLAACATPKLFVSGDDDVYAPVDLLAGIWGSAAQPSRAELIAEAGHFFEGMGGPPASKLDLMQQAMQRWLRDTLALE